VEQFNTVAIEERGIEKGAFFGTFGRQAPGVEMFKRTRLQAVGASSQSGGIGFVCFP
jgi:hypothetical protein